MAIVSIKPKGVRSWLDPQWSKRFSAALATRLANRCQGETGVVLTLTYARDPYDDAEELWFAQREEQHIALFMRALCKVVPGVKGWFAKKEFQEGGWLHFHVVVLGPAFISHSQVRETWGRGHVWIDRLTEKSTRYCCKYVAKNGEYPSWLFQLRPQSVKLVSVSRGFWGEPKPRSDTEPRMRMPGWACPLWRIADGRRTCYVQREDEKFPRAYKVPFKELLEMLISMGCVFAGLKGTWWQIDANDQDIHDAVKRLDGSFGEMATLAEVYDIGHELRIEHHPVYDLIENGLCRDVDRFSEEFADAV